MSHRLPPAAIRAKMSAMPAPPPDAADRPTIGPRYYPLAIVLVAAAAGILFDRHRPLPVEVWWGLAVAGLAAWGAIRLARRPLKWRIMLGRQLHCRPLSTAKRVGSATAAPTEKLTAAPTDDTTPPNRRYTCCRNRHLRPWLCRFIGRQCGVVAGRGGRGRGLASLPLESLRGGRSGSVRPAKGRADVRRGDCRRPAPRVAAAVVRLRRGPASSRRLAALGGLGRAARRVQVAAGLGPGDVAGLRRSPADRGRRPTALFRPILGPRCCIQSRLVRPRRLAPLRAQFSAAWRLRLRSAYR